MHETRTRSASHPSRTVRWAWVCIGLVPVGLVGSIGVLLGLASLLGVDLAPARGTAHPSLAQGLLLVAAINVVALAAPTAAVVLAVRAQRAGQGTAPAATVVATVLLVMTILAFTLLVSTAGLVGAAVVAAVLVGTLRQPRATGPGH
ncbi:hypothetical protein ABEG17_00535 [Pedococcus sp. KACC 23699]|uniref:Integral membrane protein n=1 Tax=Pedococcus sp. KACC 23699 TaxID=3149228 RepID=A0AAU7JUH3_9MICO